MNEISSHLSLLLDKAYEHRTNINEMDVIAHFQSRNKEINLWAVAKDLDHIYGVFESMGTPQRVGGLPISLLKSLSLEEKFTLPFNCGDYLNDEKREYKQVSLKYHFLLDILFQKRIVNINVIKPENYIPQNSDNWALDLGFARGLQSLPVAIKTTNLVSSHRALPSGEYSFENITGFGGFSYYLNIATLFSLLSKYCYKADSVDTLFENMADSENSQLICFANNVANKCNDIAILELLSLVNSQELNPNPTEENIDTSKLQKVALSLNQAAYSNIFSVYTNKQIIEDCSRM